MNSYNVAQTIFVGGLVSYVSLIVYDQWKKSRLPSEWIKVGKVKKLCLYPLKSGHRTEVNKAECTDVGLRTTDESKIQLKDRELVVYGIVDKEFRTARIYPQLVTVKVSAHDKNHWMFEAPNMEPLILKLPDRKIHEKVIVKCWYEELIFGIDCGEEASLWISKYVIGRGTALRLAFNDGSQRRDISKPFQKLTSYYENLGNDSTGLFSDLASISLINQTSVNDLNKRLSDSDISVHNFRSNIIIECPDMDPYDEDTWKWVKIGRNVVFRNVKENTRCSMVTINQDDGSRNNNWEPLHTLKTYRMSNGPEKSPVMGLYLGVRKTGRLRVGDTVYISRKEISNKLM